jgi:hypothetical protein
LRALIGEVSFCDCCLAVKQRGSLIHLLVGKPRTENGPTGAKEMAPPWTRRRRLSESGARA